MAFIDDIDKLSSQLKGAQCGWRLRESIFSSQNANSSQASFNNDVKQILLQFLEHEDFYVDLNTLIHNYFF